MTRAIHHNAAEQRFEWTEEGHLCVLEYTLANGVAAFTYTGVPKPVERRGIAAELVQAGLDTARAEGWRVRPLCSYVDAYIRRHPAERDLLA
jgi:predicted GNAT family acetyltransferase